ncbi:MAG: hypothetical protein VKJ24_11180 [Synechococcales bacterium]|nr:hypothetical protein [Synechococcales bacterium]
MNHGFYGSYSATCPLCGRGINQSPTDGLLICARCQAGFVTSRQGNYVRDPFRKPAPPSAKRIRLQSHPLTRLLRDARVLTPSFAAIAMGLTVLGLTSLHWAPLSGSLNQIRNFVEMKSLEPERPNP